MKILIVSDTHRHGDRFYEVLEKLSPLDMVIHCGDVEGQEDEFQSVVREMSNCPMVMVTGNNDFFSYLKSEEELYIGNYHVLVTHGHNYYVSMSNEFLKQEAKARGFDVVIYGHTHRPVVDDEDGVVAVNPGSLSYPRQEGRNPSYIIMDIDREGEAHFKICYIRT